MTANAGREDEFNATVKAGVTFGSGLTFGPAVYTDVVKGTADAARPKLTTEDPVSLARDERD
jgi:hypothetical protein